MDKEDKQTIKRAVKEEWRIGDRTRLKRLLEKNLEQYRENKTLENENRLLGERCNQLLKDKGELTDQIADLKETNAILYESAAIKQKDMEYKVSVIEQRNKKIEELENQIEKMKCCENCKHKKSEVGRCELLMYTMNACLCKNKDKWELKEIEISKRA